MGEDQHHETGWVLIPPAILAAKDLCMGEKILWGRINGLIGKRGYCFATNDWLSKQLGYSPRTIEDYIRKLVEKGYLQREYGRRGKQDRRLYPIPEIAGLLPWNSRVASLKEQGSSIGVSRNISNKEKTSASKPRFPAEDYRQVEKAYSEIKGIEPNGDEWGPIQRDIKLMFKSGNTPQTIIDFMRALEDSPLAWTDTWTIKTVRIKLPEWRADKLNLSANGDAPRIQALQDAIGEIDSYVEYKIDTRLTKLTRRSFSTETRCWKDGDLSLEESEEKAELERIRSEKLEERAQLVSELKKQEVSGA